MKLARIAAISGILGAISVGVGPRAAHAFCAMLPLHPAVMTTRSTALPADGGILVSYTAGKEDEGEPETTDPSETPTWRAFDGAGHALKYDAVSLAPGLRVLVPAAGTGAITIKGKRDNVIGTFTRDSKAAPVALAAPKPATLRVEVSLGAHGSMELRGQITLAVSPPADAVAVITYQIIGSTKQTVGASWLPATHDKLKTWELGRAGGHCHHGPDGVPMPGTQVTFAYVDAFGRLSPQSKPITVAELKPAPSAP